PLPPGGKPEPRRPDTELLPETVRRSLQLPSVNGRRTLSERACRSSLLRKELHARCRHLVIMGVLSGFGDFDPPFDRAARAFLYDRKVERGVGLEVARQIGAQDELIVLVIRE